MPTRLPRNSDRQIDQTKGTIFMRDFVKVNEWLVCGLEAREIVVMQCLWFVCTEFHGGWPWCVHVSATWCSVIALCPLTTVHQLTNYFASGNHSCIVQ